MRLFTAIEIPEEVRDVLSQTVERLKPSAKIRWSRPSNLHITTKFLGEIAPERFDTIVGSLRGVAATGPIPIEVRGAGWFPNPHSPRILYAGVQAPESLGQLHRRTDERLEALGVKTETKPFRPHLTLARIEGKVDLADLRHAIFALPSNRFGAFTASHFHLYESKTAAGGSIYTKLAEFEI